jgi:hypothetical protein
MRNCPDDDDPRRALEELIQRWSRRLGFEELIEHRCFELIQRRCFRPYLPKPYFDVRDQRNTEQIIRRAGVYRPDDNDPRRALEELIQRWCRRLWLRGPDFNASLDLRDQWDAEQISRIAVKPIKFEKPEGMKRKDGTISHHHELSWKGEALRNTARYLESHVRPGRRRIRHYVFTAVCTHLGSQPFRVLSSVGMLLYNLGPADLAEVFGGNITPDGKTISQWRKSDREMVETIFAGGKQWDDNCPMLEAEGHAMHEMLRVLEWLSEDLNLSPGWPLDDSLLHVKDFESAYQEVSTVQRQNGYGREHRIPELERVAEHLIVCVKCGGVPRLVKKTLPRSLPGNPDKPRIAPAPS